MGFLYLVCQLQRYLFNRSQHVLLNEASDPPPLVPVVADQAAGLREEILLQIVPVVHPEIKARLDWVLVLKAQELLGVPGIFYHHNGWKTWHVEFVDRSVFFKKGFENFVHP